MHQIKSIPYSSLFIFLLCTSFISAQKKTANFKEGYIKYELKVFGVPEVAEFTQETNLFMYIQEDNAKLELRIMGGFASIQLLSQGQEHFHTALLDIPMLSEKVAITTKSEITLLNYLEGQVYTNQTPKKLGKVKYFPKDKRRIAKHKCYRAELPVNGNDDRIIVYLTKKLRVNKAIQPFPMIKGLDGFPLAFEMEIDGVRVYLYANEVKKRSLDNALFLIPDDYNKKTVKEFKKELEEFFDEGKKQGVRM